MTASETAPASLPAPVLRSGGLMLGYQCNQSCRHCVYRSRPGAGAWMTESILAAAADRLAGERRLVDIHIGGGEPTLNPPLLTKAIRLLREKKVRLSYVETNVFFADTADKAREMFLPLRDAGLRCVLISISPYHNEFIPLRTTLNGLEAAMEVFGEDGVFPWLSHFLPMLSRLDPDRTHTLPEFLAANGMAENDPSLLQLFPLTPGGRAPEGLAGFFPPRPAEAFRNGHCGEIISGGDHFHIDPEGRIFTGHCPGIASGRVGDPDPGRGKTPDRDPVYCLLASGGPCALMDAAAEQCGFEPDPAGYASPCELCFQVRKSLFRYAPERWMELGPEVFYGE